MPHPFKPIKSPIHLSHKCPIPISHYVLTSHLLCEILSIDVPVLLVLPTQHTTSTWIFSKKKFYICSSTYPSAAWYEFIGIGKGQWKGKYFLSFHIRGVGKEVTHCVFGHFFYPRIASGVENCCCDDLAQLLLWVPKQYLLHWSSDIVQASLWLHIHGDQNQCVSIVQWNIGRPWSFDGLPSIFFLLELVSYKGLLH